MSSVFDQSDGRPWSRLTKTDCLSDGVVLIDPEYLKERKGELPVQTGAWPGPLTGCASYLLSLLSLQSSSP